MVQEGSVVMVLWQEMPNVFNKMYAFQPTMISHALLAHWGYDVRLIIGDVDEFVATPIAHQSIHTLFNSCDIQALSYIQRREYLCMLCMKELSSFERSLWEGRVNQSTPVKYYDYSKVQQSKGHNNNPKGIVDPNKICTWSVHTGVPIQENLEFYNIASDCLYLAHLRHMFRERKSLENDLENFVEDSFWLWMFR
eukprot:TRINITY_DN4977_c0_g1_i2.p1 TRINITY_DN4977_c0_g1~~TRINITY_DN4977_c0_g1_i2.p1  ORF type:complete len:195 (-),score=14.17 TRINITY_DN4977_c0_g1_i2:137-721(-)